MKRQPSRSAATVGPASKETPNYITTSGYARLAAELKRLRTVDRPKVVDEVSHAASLGDRSENAEYIYGKKKLREIDRRMRFLTKRIDAAVVIDPSQERRGNKIFFGATVTIDDGENESTVQLVGVDEVNASDGKISWRSPLGAALLGKEEGDEVRFKAPAGVRTYEIVEVVYR